MAELGDKSFFEVSLRDATSEITTTKFYGTPLTALDFIAQVTLQGALEVAIDNVTLGVLAKDAFGIQAVISNGVPTDQAAQRESKLLVQMISNTTEYPFTLTIGTIDFSKLAFVPGGGDAVPLDASAEIVALVSAINAYAKNPRDTAEPAHVASLRFVGRNT